MRAAIRLAKSASWLLLLGACSKSVPAEPAELAPAAPASAPAGGMDGAGSIALGLDWRSGVYVQQLWERGELEYLVFNERAEDIDVLVEHGCLPSDTGEKLEPCAVSPVAGPWH